LSPGAAVDEESSFSVLRDFKPTHGNIFGSASSLNRKDSPFPKYRFGFLSTQL